jgi:hypothetical protein
MAGATSLVISVLADVSKAVEGIDKADKKTQSFGTTMKAAGGAIAGAFSTEKIIGWAQTALSAGMELKGAMKNVTLVFGDAADGVKAWGETAASSFGMTASAADEAAAKVGVALTGFGLSQQDAAKYSEALVQRATEMAKVMGVDVSEVLAKVSTAMRGRTAGLKDYGVVIEKGTGQATNMAKAQGDVEKATANQTKAQQHLADVQTDLAGKTTLTTAEQRRLRDAQDGVTSANMARLATEDQVATATTTSSGATEILNAFLDQTKQYGGRADTTMGEFHATMGNLTEQLGLALIPVLNTLMPIFQSLANWATTHRATFNAIVIVVGALALAFSIAATAAGIFALASLSAMWPILLVVGAVAALIAVVVLIIKYWGDLVGWFHTAVGAVQGVIDKLGPLIFLFGPLGVAIGTIENFGKAWDAVHTAVSAVLTVIQKVVDAVGGAASKIGDFLSHIPHIPGLNIPGVTTAAGASSAGVSPYASPVVFAPSITFTGDVGDPVLAGRRIVAALESWTAANGRRRVAALVGP